MKISASKNLESIKTVAIADINHLYETWLEHTMPQPYKMIIYRAKYEEAKQAINSGISNVNFPAFVSSYEEANTIIEKWESLHIRLSQIENKRIYIINRIREANSETKIKELVSEFAKEVT